MQYSAVRSYDNYNCIANFCSIDVVTRLAFLFAYSLTLYQLMLYSSTLLYCHTYPHTLITEYGWLLLSLVCCVCSVLSKEQGITVLALCGTYDLFIARNVRIIKSTFCSHNFM